MKKQKAKFIVLYSCFTVIWLVWFLYNFTFKLYLSNYQMPITMFFGGFIAGFTSEGGGAVAFPVFTKLLKVPPHVARDFSFCIQSVGMTFASLTILIKKIKVEKNVVKFATTGGLLGIVLGSYLVDPYVLPAVVRITFSIVLASFGMMIYMKNFKLRIQERDDIEEMASRDKCLIFCVGIIGGIFSSLIGTGGDFITFSFVVLYLKLSEKVATPTSVIIMSLESIFGSFFRLLILHDLSNQAITYFALCAPVVAVMAPLGAVLCSKVSRMLIVKFLLFLIIVEFTTTLIIFKFRLTLVIPVLVIFAIQIFLYNIVARRKAT